MKKVLSIILAIMMFISVMPITASADAVGGPPDYDGLKLISGDYEYAVLSETDKTCLIESYSGTATKLIIPEKINGYSVIRLYDESFAYLDISSVKIPDSVLAIGSYVFVGCNNLKNVTIPRSVEYIGYGSFNCINLTEIFVDGDNQHYSTDEYGVLFNKNKTQLVNYPLGNARTSYEIPDSVTTVRSSAFEYNQNLTSIIIPNKVTTIEYGAFENCNSLTDIYYLGTEEQWYDMVSISGGNDPLLNATIHFNSSGGDGEPDNPELEIITGDFLCATSTGWNGVKDYQYSYSDEFFARETDEYYHDLALMSLALEASACVPDGAWDGYEKIDEDNNENTNEYANKRPENAYKLLEKIEFDWIEDYGYNSKTTFDSVACVVAAKNIYLNDSDTTIIAVAVRGSGYEAEWGGNFRMGESSMNHEGFDIAKSEVLDNVEDFVSLYGDNFNSNIKIWITGYSRGAAIANLVASEFNKGKLSDYPNINNLGVIKDNVYAYCFATPKNTTDKEASSSKYNNIFSIVNPIDLVPYVAPGNDGFDFTRYGVTYFTPSMESTANYNDKNGVLSQMSKTHKSIYGTEYDEDFTFIEYENSWVWTWDNWYQPEWTIISENKSIGQTTYIDNLVDILAEEAVQDRQNYYDNYEGAVIKLVACFMGDYDIQYNEEMLDDIYDVMLEYFTSINRSTKKLKENLAEAISEHTTINYNEAISLLGELDGILTAASNNPSYVLTGWKNLSGLIESHKMHVYLSWMAYLDEGDNYKELLSTTQTCRKIQINCPVDVDVYDSDGNLVVSFIDDKVVDVEDESLSAYIDGNGQKCVALPFDDEYRIEITARDSCDVTVSVSEYNFATSMDEKLINYYDVNIAKNETIECIAENDILVDECEYPITDSNGGIIKPDDIMEGNNIETFSVTTECNIDEINVLGGGKYTVGEFSQVTAIKIEGYNFLGWYNGDELITTDYQYRFCVLQDATLTAVYEKSQEPVYNYTFSIQTPSRTEIRHKDGIKLHANVVGEVPKGSYVSWSADNNKFKTEEINNSNSLKIVSNSNGYTTFTATLYSADGEILATDTIEMKSKAGFFDKIGSFFRSIFGGTKIYEN